MFPYITKTVGNTNLQEIKMEVLLTQNYILGEVSNPVNNYFLQSTILKKLTIP